MEELEKKQAEIIIMLHDVEALSFAYIAHIMNSTTTNCEWLYNNYYQPK